MVGGKQRAHGNGLVDAAKGLADKVGVEFGRLAALGGQANLRHFLHRLQRVLARSSFGREHDGVGAIKHRVGHVAHLGAGGHRVGDHGLHHLRGGDHHLVVLASELDHALLQCGYRRVTDFDRQVAARNHDAVAGQQYLQQLGNRLGAFDFGNQAGLVVVLGGCHIAELARHFHVGGAFRKAHGHIVGLKGHGGADVVHVFGSQRGRGEAAALLVNAFVVRQLTAQLDGGVYLLTHHRIHGDDDQAVVQQEGITSLHFFGQRLVVQADGVDVAEFSACSVQNELVAVFQKHLALGKLTNANLGPLQIGHDGHLAPGALGGFAHQAGPVNVVLGRAVAEVQPHHIDASANQCF